LGGWSIQREEEGWKTGRRGDFPSRSTGKADTHLALCKKFLG